MTPITFAHRGARADLPENTLPAFARALERGARGLETDAHLSADGEAVLVHDAAFRKGLRRVRVATSTAGDLAQLDVPSLTDLYRDFGAAYELSIDLKAEGVEEPIRRGRGRGRRTWNGCGSAPRASPVCGRCESGQPR